jgi:hypothetical protein
MTPETVIERMNALLDKRRRIEAIDHAAMYHTKYMAFLASNPAPRPDEIERTAARYRLECRSGRATQAAQLQAIEDELHRLASMPASGDTLIPAPSAVAA